MSSWLGLDIGTSSLKALLIDDDGRVLARSSIRYQEPQANDLATEQQPDTWVAAAAEAIAHCVAEGGVPSGIGLCGQVPTLVLVDDNGSSVRPAMTWQDSRAVQEASRLASLIGDSEPHIGIDLPWSASQIPAKLLWLSENENSVVSPRIRALQPKDYLGLKLTGSYLTDAWSSKGLTNVLDGTPATTMIEATGWPVEVCPPTSLPWEQRGVTLPGALGLPAGIPVSVGWSDALASMLAVGAFLEPRAFILTGTSDIVGMSVEEPTPGVRGLYRVPQECAPRAVVYGPTQSSGSSLLWLSSLLGRSVDELLALAATAPRAGAPVFVPFLAGERAPLWQPDVRALFAGVSVEHGVPDITLSVLRGVALSASHILRLASTAGSTSIEGVHIAGRDVLNGAWTRVRLETLGVPLLLHPEPFTSALGAAMLGAAATNDGDLGIARELGGKPVIVQPEERDAAAAVDSLDDYLRASAVAQEWVHA